MAVNGPRINATAARTIAALVVSLTIMAVVLILILPPVYSAAITGAFGLAVAAFLLAVSAFDKGK